MRTTRFWLATILGLAAGCGGIPVTALPTQGDGGVELGPLPPSAQGADAAQAVPTTSDAGVATGPTSRCVRDGSVLRCSYQKTIIEAGGLSRAVFWQLPVGTPPPGGFPVVIMFQPSIYWAEAHWTGFTTIEGQIYATENIRTLLDAGYAVITPQAQALVNTVWETNVPVVNADWPSTHDHALMQTLFAQIESGYYGPLDASNLFATGMSSGGYMTSRMALSYPGRFRALVVQSGAWATCVGPVNTLPVALVCNPPSTLPADHPPTLFLHGTLDPVVPIGTMRRYHDAMLAQGFEARKVEVPFRLHEFFSVTPTETLAWFEAHRR